MSLLLRTGLESSSSWKGLLKGKQVTWQSPGVLVCPGPIRENIDTSNHKVILFDFQEVTTMGTCEQEDVLRDRVLGGM